MRAFLGLSPDANTKLAIDTWRNKALPNLETLVHADNFHVTLAFLGNVTSEQLEVIIRLIDEMPKITDFDVSLNLLGYWPKPKAFWLGCQQTAINHQKLTKHLHEIAKKSGLLLQEKDYVAHLTLARKCKASPPAPLFPAHFLWHVNQFHLFESKSNAQGVYYSIQQSWPIYNK
ncbi:MAG: 2'-5' RNA ligase [Flavobacteriales bacterium]|jgi:2'-5' RNA ligase